MNYVGAPPLGLNLVQGSWNGSASGGYPGGAPFGSVDGKSWDGGVEGQDLTFQTYVEPTFVPEPSSALLIAVGAMCILVAKASGRLTNRRCLSR